jgi:hypothetical protein
VPQGLRRRSGIIGRVDDGKLILGGDAATGGIQLALFSHPGIL